MAYDIVIVGAGLSGCAIINLLAPTGLKILVLERGLAAKDWDKEYSSNYAEFFKMSATEHSEPQKCEAKNREIYNKSGRCTYQVNSWTPVLGGGEGGGSSVYGAVLLRYKPFDFKKWPFSYSEIQKYYKLAEELVSPMGEMDPLDPQNHVFVDPKPISVEGKELMAFMINKGLHPFRTPIGYSAKENCRHCFGFYCSSDCKRTGTNIFLKPISQFSNVEFKYSVCVEELIEEDNKIKGVRCRNQDGVIIYNARYIFLTAGALITPVILMNSKSQNYPMGVGNKYDNVGRYLMRHLIDLYFVKTPSSHLAKGHLNELSATDFYVENAERWGVLSMVPGLMPTSLMAREVCERIGKQLGIPFLKICLLPIIKGYLKLQSKNRILITAINEDSPCLENRVLPGSTPDALKINYRITKADSIRLQQSRKFYGHLFKPLASKLVKVAEDNSFLAHVCGTCRMGNSPVDAVVDSSGKVFDLDNLYIADSSIFPTSSGVNPSLTIMACALKIAAEFRINVLNIKL